MCGSEDQIVWLGVWLKADLPSSPRLGPLSIALASSIHSGAVLGSLLCGFGSAPPFSLAPLWIQVGLGTLAGLRTVSVPHGLELKPGIRSSKNMVESGLTSFVQSMDILPTSSAPSLVLYNKRKCFFWGDGGKGEGELQVCYSPFLPLPPPLLLRHTMRQHCIDLL